MQKTLDVHMKQTVSYCIPIWLRDLQVEASTKRITGRIEPHYEQRPEPVAVVCFGPSLKETWEKIREFKHIVTCSGAHKFLIERGIIPTWHVEVDPRPHKATLLGPPHPEVMYLPSSTCHPKYFDHLEGFQVKLWHVFSNEDNVQRLLPANEWALTGGPDVGLRAMLIARFFGFTDLHIFGMDGCVRESGSHADAHPNSIKTTQPCEYEGVTYQTTVALLECARTVAHELNMMKDVKATFYGEGLTQAMMRRYSPAPPAGKAVLGITKPELISVQYRELNAQLHRENPFYGVSAEKHVPAVLKLAEALKTKNILDYGCGKGLLGRGIPWQIAEYDPCIAGKNEPPKPADIVCCIDVLEHIEPEKLAFVLDDLRRCVRQVGYFTISTGPARKTLSDGRNTHLIQHGKEWWEKRLRKFFEVGKIIEVGMELHCVVGPKRVAEKLPAESRPMLQEAMA